MAPRAFITGLSGLALTAEERAFLRDARPWGLILFKRNIQDKNQVVDLVREAISELGGNSPVLIDQEGGRVQRLGPPHWPAYPAGAAYGRIYDGDPHAGLVAARLGARLIAADLVELGINVDCLPLADVPVPGADGVIGDRAYGDTPDKVAAIAAAIAEGLADGGVLPVLKHIPGHGRANADSHEKLPVVHASRATLEASDFAAFRPLKKLPLAMTAHVVFTAIDPVHPARSCARDRSAIDPESAPIETSSPINKPSKPMNPRITSPIIVAEVVAGRTGSIAVKTTWAVIANGNFFRGRNAAKSVASSVARSV